MSDSGSEKAVIRLQVNGRELEGVAEPRRLLSDFIRHDLGMTGTHVGCEHGVCGACTILLDGDAVRSCLMFAVQAEGSVITTIEGLGQTRDDMDVIQRAFWESHGLQCGFCTPGMVLATKDLLERTPMPTDDQIREGLAGNMCRCTGYVFIVKAVKAAAEELNARASVDG
ncbi:MAG: aerobic carbon-monoxide dehydrogenase small subunit [Actinomycetota bacterium]|nr:aerobic carbon-monoxide dehydrogenase small subunit [Actinomycetota bacterium]